MTAAATTAPVATVTPAVMISRILGAAKNAAILQNRHAEYQANAANYFINLTFKTEEELLSICKKLQLVS